MSSTTIVAAQQRRSCLLACSFLVPVLSLGISAVHAQQSASPNLLPTIEVEAPANQTRTRPEPAAERPSRSRRPAPTAPQVPTDAQQSGKPAKEPAIVVSPTATETPIDQIASSVTVITAKDIERDQRRTVPDALSTVPGLCFSCAATRASHPMRVSRFIRCI